MPFFRFHAVDESRLAGISDFMIDQIEKTVECPREHIVFEVINSSYISGREAVAKWPFVEISWFKRTLDIQDRVAEIIYEGLRQAGYDNSDVYFRSLSERNYYENGQHY